MGDVAGALPTRSAAVAGARELQIAMRDETFQLEDLHAETPSLACDLDELCAPLAVGALETRRDRGEERAIGHAAALADASPATSTVAST